MIKFSAWVLGIEKTQRPASQAQIQSGIAGCRLQAGMGSENSLAPRADKALLARGIRVAKERVNVKVGWAPRSLLRNDDLRLAAF